MNKHHCFRLLTAFCLLLASQGGRASIYDIICVECSLSASHYNIFDPLSGTSIADNAFVVPGSLTEMESSLFGLPLYAHDINFYLVPDTYSFDSQGDLLTPAQTISMTVLPGQVGMHMLFDWNGNTDIDVLAVFNVAQIGKDTAYLPVDVGGNGIPGFEMVDGPFQGNYFSATFVVTTPLPAASWLFLGGAGLLSAVARRRPRTTL